MIKRIFFAFCFAIVSISAVSACGCSASGIGIGLMTDYRSNFIRLSYLENRFSSNLERGHSEFSDVFSRMNFSFRYSFRKLPKLRFTGTIPYGYNFREESGVETSFNGFSDARFVVNYAFLNTMSESMTTSLYLEAGGGVSLPTGKYNSDIKFEDNLPENFNIGNGSLGYIFQMNAVLSYNKYGLLINNNYQMNSGTKQGYHFGNQFSSQLTAFREIKISTFAIIPNVGLLYEQLASDEYSNGNRVPETGGKGFFISSAINYKTERWLAGFSYSLPMAQDYSNGVIDAGRKVSIHISYLF